MVQPLVPLQRAQRVASDGARNGRVPHGSSVPFRSGEELLDGLRIAGRRTGTAWRACGFGYYRRMNGNARVRRVPLEPLVCP